MKKIRPLRWLLLTAVCLSLPQCVGIPAIDYNEDGVVTVLVFGDSNSEPGWQGFPNWCEKLQGMVPANWDIICEQPYTRGGAMAVGSGNLFHLPDQLTAALDAEIPFDVAIFSYGTNDWLVPGMTKEQIIAAYDAANARIDNLAVFVATTPMRVNCVTCCEIHGLNMSLREHYPVAGIIDFDGGFNYSDYSDNVHMSEAGHQKRAIKAYKRLIPST